MKAKWFSLLVAVLLVLSSITAIFPPSAAADEPVRFTAQVVEPAPVIVIRPLPAPIVPQPQPEPQPIVIKPFPLGPYFGQDPEDWKAPIAPGPGPCAGPGDGGIRCPQPENRAYTQSECVPDGTTHYWVTVEVIPGWTYEVTPESDPLEGIILEGEVAKGKVIFLGPDGQKEPSCWRVVGKSCPMPEEREVTGCVGVDLYGWTEQFVDGEWVEIPGTRHLVEANSAQCGYKPPEREVTGCVGVDLYGWTEQFVDGEWVEIPGTRHLVEANSAQCGYKPPRHEPPACQEFIITPTLTVEVFDNAGFVEPWDREDERLTEFPPSSVGNDGKPYKFHICEGEAFGVLYWVNGDYQWQVVGYVDEVTDEPIALDMEMNRAMKIGGTYLAPANMFLQWFEDEAAPSDKDIHQAILDLLTEQASAPASSEQAAPEQVAEPVETVAELDAETTYVVKAGDSLWSLFGSSWKAVAEANGITDPRLLSVGAVLTIPQGVVLHSG